jgi:hypothetical protein
MSNYGHTHDPVLTPVADCPKCEAGMARLWAELTQDAEKA